MNDTIRSTPGHIPMLWLVLPQITGYALAPSWAQLGQPLWLVSSSLVLLLVAYVSARNSFQLLRWSPFYLAGAILLAAGYWNWRHPPQPTGGKLAVREAEVVISIERATHYPTRNYSSVYGKVIAAPPHITQLEGQKLFITMSRNVDTIDPAQWIRGAHYRVRGILMDHAQPPTEEAYSFHQYLYRNGYYYRLQRARMVEQLQSASSFQQWCYRHNQRLQAIAQHGAQSEQELDLARIFTGMMLGITNVIPAEQKNNFRVSGTMHLFAISGLHIGVIAATLYMLLQILRLPPLPRCVIALGILWLYVHITGASPSAVRAFFMALFYWAATGFRRKRSSLSALLASAFAVLVYDPQQMLSVGFQLSYTVVGGILLYGQPLISTLQNRWVLFRLTPEDALSMWQKSCHHLWRWSLGLLGISIAAFMFSVPLTIAYFQIFAPGAILLNTVLVPLASLVIVGGCVSFSMGMIYASGLSYIFNHGAWLVMLCMTTLLEITVQLPWIFGSTPSVSLSRAVACECLMFAWLLGMNACKQQQRLIYYIGPPIILLGLM